MYFRSSTVCLADDHCPAAFVHSQIGTPREPLPEMMIGKVVHAIVEAAALAEPDRLYPTIESTVTQIQAKGMSFEGGPPDFPAPGETLAGRELALGLFDRFTFPPGQLQPELAVNLGVTWQLVKDGSPDTYWRQLLDLLATYVDLNAYGEEVVVAHGLDLKGWNGGPEWVNTTQGKAAAVSLAAVVPEAEIIRRTCFTYRLGGPWTTDLDLSDERDVAELEEFRSGLMTVCRGLEQLPMDVEATARPGPGCIGCPYLRHCSPGASYLATVETPFGSNEDAANAWSSAEAVRIEAASWLRSLPDPVLVEGGWKVGYKEVEKNVVRPAAPSLLAAAWCEHVLRSDGDKSKIESLLRSQKLGVTQVRKMVSALIKKGMDKEAGEELEGKCLEIRTNRKLGSWPVSDEPDEPDTLEDDLRATLEGVGK